MSDDVTARIERVDTHIATVQAAREREFARWKRHYGGPSGEMTKWVPHLAEIGRAVDAAVPRALAPDVFDDLTSIADAFLAADEPSRDALTERCLASKSLVVGHDAYLAEARGRIEATRDADWLRRALAMSALVCGGNDARDEQLALEDLVRVARAAGVDPAPEFRRVAALASATRSFGGARESVRAFLEMLSRR